MFNKVYFHDIGLIGRRNPLLSLSYTELNDEPSIFHTHQNFEIIVPRSGSGQIVGISKSFQIEPNCVYIIPANATHTEKKINPSSDFKYYALKTTDSIRLESTDFLKVELEPLFMQNLLAHLKCSYNNLVQYPDDTFLSYLDAFSFYLMLINRLKEKGYKVEDGKSKLYSSFVFEVQSYINESYSEDIEMTALAKKYGMSRSSLEKRFKKETGITPKEYLSNRRLEAAKYLLLTSDYSIGQIASLCGFSTAAYFIYFFRIETGKTPKLFRIEAEQENNS